jgi:hypothetical protein
LAAALPVSRSRFGRFTMLATLPKQRRRRPAGATAGYRCDHSIAQIL